MPGVINGIGVETRRGRFWTKTPFALKDSLRAIKGRRWEKGDKMWSFPATPRVVNALDSCFRQHLNGGAYWMDATFQKLWEYCILEGHYCSDWFDGRVTPIPKVKTKPWDHQVRAFWFAVERLGGLHDKARGGVMLELDMGCGKTKTMIDLVSNYGWWRTLIVCPQKVVEGVWPGEAKLHASIDLRVLPLTGALSKRVVDLRRATSFQNQPLLAVTNYEAFDNAGFRDVVREVEWDAVALDEGHRIKDPGGKRSKWFGRFADHVPCRFELTGTSMPNGPLDLYAQGRWLDASCWGTSYAAFRGTYALLGGYAVNGVPVQILGYQNEEDLAREKATFSIQVDADDVQDLPEKYHVRREVALNKETQRLYDRMDAECVIEFADEDVIASNVLVKLGKLQEITGGFVRNPETEALKQISQEKADVVDEILRDLPPNDPVVVFCRFRPDLDKIHEVAKGVGRDSLEVSGRTNQLKQWQEASGGEVLVAQIASGKEGVNLTRARWTIYYSLGYQPGEFEQSLKRTNRPGQKAERTTFFHIVAGGTVDEAIYKAIRDKTSVIENVKRRAREVSQQS